MRAQGAQRKYPRCGKAVDERVAVWLHHADEGTQEEGWDPDILFEDLDLVRRAMNPDYWALHAVPRIRRHPMYARAMECPFSRYSAEKPRGYAGDARMLDFVYGDPSEDPLFAAASPRGQALTRFWMNSPAAEALRARTAWLRARLDRLAEEVCVPRVFAVGCGHLPELVGSEAACRDAFASFVALDRDPVTLSCVANVKPVRRVALVEASVRTLLAEEPLERFDLVYAVGLYDHLPQGFAAKLTRALFERLAPGGELVIDNFMPSNPNIGAMEAFQDWWLTYRTQAELEALLDGIEPSRQARRAFLTDPDQCIGLLSVQAT